MGAREELAAIRERVEAATEGPWDTDGGGASIGYGPVWVAHVVDNGALAEPVRAHADAEFIAHARTDVPRLVGLAETVLGLHKPHAVICLNPTHSKDCDGEVCDTCDATYPCPTVRAIEAALTTDAKGEPR